MNIAELFVELGIKGAEKTVGTLTAVKKGMADLGSTSLETKAAIVGAMYGLERMMAISGAAGTGFTNFTALTGKSAQDLQRWQFAARQAGVGADELTGSMKAVQTGMANMLLGKGAPEGMALLSKAVGGINPKDYRDTFAMMQHLQTGLQKMSPEMAQSVGKSFGLSENTIAAMRRNMFTPKMLAQAPVYSDKEIGSLDKSNIAWANLGNKIQMAFGHFNAKHGQALVGDISKTVDQIVKLAEAFDKLATKLKVFDVINEIFKGWGFIFEGIGDAVDKLMGFMGKGKGTKDSAFDKSGNLKKNPVAMFSDWIGDQVGKQVAMGGLGERWDKMKEEMAKNGMPSDNWNKMQADAAKPKVTGNQTSVVTTHNTNVNQNIAHHGDAKDTRAVKDLHKSAVNHAYRQRAVQRQGS